LSRNTATARAIPRDLVPALAASIAYAGIAAGKRQRRVDELAERPVIERAAT